MHVRWTPNFSVSALHAAHAVCTFRTQVTDSRIAETFENFAGFLQQWCVDSGHIEPSRFWHILISTALDIESNYELLEATLRKCGAFADSTTVTALAGMVTDIEAAFKQMFPKYLEQIQFRTRPLQEQWLGYSGGLIAHIGRLTEKELLVDEAKVVAVQPVLGGFGVAHIQNNMVRVEAMLTNPLAELPEIVRLVWLLSQLQLELPRFSDLLGTKVLEKVAPLAMLPPALASAQVVELSHCTNEVAAMAIEHWHVPTPAGLSLQDDVVPALMDWWETYLQTRPTWHIAMQALAKMLGLTI